LTSNGYCPELNPIRQQPDPSGCQLFVISHLWVRKDAFSIGGEVMLKVNPISLSEREELEPILVKNPSVIEAGLKVLAHQHQTDSGPLDILAVDAEGTLVVIELKSQPSEGHLDQGLRYYDWCRKNISWISSAYSNKANVNPDLPPRLLLIAPSFTETVSRIAKYVDVELELIEYHAFEDENGKKGLICKSIDYGQPPVPPEIPSLEKKMEYFHLEKVKQLFKAVLDELAEKEVEIKPISGLWISFWYKNKRFMYMSPKRQFFIVEVLAPDGDWCDRMRVKTKKEWENTFKEYISKYMEYLDSNA